MTGQILDADVTIRAPLNFIFGYNAFSMPLSFQGFGETNSLLAGKINPWDQDNLAFGMERDFGILEMLATGRISDIKEVPKEYVYDALKQLACHEVGHTLGLRHNFKGSSTIALKDLHNTALTSKESIGSSIMEYLPANLAPKGGKQGDYFQKTIGAWDYWAIEYGYRPIDVKSLEDELPQLNKIAGRSTEPALIYGTDEDAYDLAPYATSVDPLAMTFDLSDDPLAFAEQDLRRTQDLWKELENRVLFEGRSYAYLRKAFESSLSRYSNTLIRLTRWIGGIYHTRVHVGDRGKGLPFQVVEYDKQRRALEIIKTKLLNPEAFAFDPAFIQKLQFERFVDLDAWEEASEAGKGPLRIDFSLSAYLEHFYRRIVRDLYDPMRLHRIQDNPLRATGKTLSLGDFLSELHNAIWQEVVEAKPVNAYRRILQRECLARISQFVLKPSSPLPEDAVPLFRYELKQLGRSIDDYLVMYPELDIMTRAHLENCSDLIAQALKAGYIKSLEQS